MENHHTTTETSATTSIKPYEDNEQKRETVSVSSISPDLNLLDTYLWTIKNTVYHTNPCCVYPYFPKFVTCPVLRREMVFTIR
jgi:hypothetical protein